MSGYDDVTAWIAEQAAKADLKKPESAETASLPEEDAADEYDASDIAGATDAALVGRAFFIFYADPEGAKWRRRILVRGLTTSPDGAVKVHAYCFERDAPRSFFADRIERMVCSVTNEIIEQPRDLIVASLQGAAAAGASKEQILADRELLKAARDGVRLLMFLARCDDHFHPHERAVIHDYVRRRAAMFDGLYYDEGFVDKYLDLQYPDREVAIAGWRRILAEGDETHTSILLDSLEKLIGADGVVAARESSFLSLLKSLKHMSEPGYQGRGDDDF